MTNNSTLSTADTADTCSITNNTSVNALVLTPAAVTAPGNDSGNTGILTQLALGSGNSNIPVNGTDTVTLDEQYTDPTSGKPADVLVYELILSTTDWAFPLKNAGVMQNLFGPPGYPPVTASADDQAALINAAKFQQTIMAYPSSQLAKNYLAAMTATQQQAVTSNDPDGNSVAASIDTSVNAFFQSTKSFQNVTLSGLMAVQAYYNTYPFAWAEYQNATTYYLYSSTGTAMEFIGTIAMNRTNTVLDLTSGNGGFTFTYTPSLNASDLTTVATDPTKAMTLQYTSGQLVSDLTSDIPAVCVQGLFMLKNTFSNNPNDSSIITILSGTVNGNTVMGMDQAQLQTPNDPNSTFWSSLFDPKGSAAIFQSIMTIGGALMFLHFIGTSVYGIYKWAKNQGAAKEPTTADLLKQQSDKFEQMIKDNNADLIKKMSAGRENAPADPVAAQANVDNAGVQVDAYADAGRVQQGVQVEAGRLEVMAQFEQSMSGAQMQSLEANASAAQAVQQNIQNASPENIADVVSAQKVQLTDLNANVSSLQSGVLSSVSAQAQQELASSQAVSDAVVQDMKQLDDQKAAEDGNDPSDGDDFKLPEGGE